MGVTLTDLPAALAPFAGQTVLHMEHCAKHAKRQGQLRGTPGTNRVLADSNDAVRLLLPGLMGVPQVMAPEVIQRVGSLVSDCPLVRVYMWHEERYYAWTLGDEGTHFLEFWRRSLDGLRYPGTMDAVLGFQEIRIRTAAGQSWAETHINPPTGPEIARFIPAVHVAGQIPAWAKPPGAIRTAEITLGSLLDLAALLGRLPERPAWPREDIIDLRTQERPASEAGEPFPDSVARRANAEQIAQQSLKDTDSADGPQPGLPETGLAVEKSCLASTSRRRRTA